MVAKKQIFVLQNYSHVTKIWKTTFPVEFFNVWLKVGEYEYIYTYEIKFEKKIFCLKMAARKSFMILRNNANLS